MLLKRYTALALVLLFLWALTPVAQGESQFWQCPGCSQWNSQSYQFCPHCGTQRPTYRQCPNCHYQTTDTAYTYCPVCGTVLQTVSGALPTATPQPYIYGHTIDRLSTRSGPSTDFTGTGTYQVKDQDVPIFSVAYDVNGVAWVQCEVSYGGALRRVYTGLKRFDATTVDLSKVRAESSYTEAQRASLPHQTTLRYGPGTGIWRLPAGCGPATGTGHPCGERLGADTVHRGGNALARMGDGERNHIQRLISPSMCKEAEGSKQSLRLL